MSLVSLLTLTLTALRVSCEACVLKLNRAAQKKKAAAALPAIPGLDPKEWTPLTLEEVKKYNHNSHTFKFDFEGDDKDQKTAGLSVAGCILVRSPTGEGQVNDDKGKPVIRPYTPVSAHDARGHIELLIKEYPVGLRRKSSALTNTDGKAYPLAL